MSEMRDRDDPDDGTTRVHARSPVDAKIRLFRSLFRGREDVYPRRFENLGTGRSGYATPPGAFVITNKNRDWRSTIYHVRMPFFLRLSCGDFGLHQGNVPGYPASHGCIRVPAGKAEELFSLAEIGDAVEITP